MCTVLYRNKPLQHMEISSQLFSVGFSANSRNTWLFIATECGMIAQINIVNSWVDDSHGI